MNKKTNNKYIEELAKTILEDSKDKKMSEEIFKDPEPIEKEPEVLKPIMFEEGFNRNTAFVVKHERDIRSILNKYFGHLNGDYFIVNEGTSHKSGKPFKTLLVEDKNGFCYTLWFNIEQMSLLYGLKY